MRIMPGGALETEQSLSGPSSIFVGKKLDEHRGSFFLEYPMDKGSVVDGGWDAMESIWEVRDEHRRKNTFCFQSESPELLFCYCAIASLFETKSKC